MNQINEQKDKNLSLWYNFNIFYIWINATTLRIDQKCLIDELAFNVASLSCVCALKNFSKFLLVVGQISLFRFLYRSLVFQFKFFTHRYTNEQHLNYVYLQIFAFCFGMLCLMPGFSNKIMLRHLYFLWWRVCKNASLY